MSVVENFNTAKTETFVRLLMAHDHELFAYTFSLMPNADDAREVIQEAAVLMWQHFDEFDTSRPFFPWASRFAYFTVLSFRRKKQSAPRLLSEESVKALADEYYRRREEFDERAATLRICVEKLPPPARMLLKRRYEDGRTVTEIARRTRRNIHTLYKAFEKIRDWLLECLERRLRAEGEA